MDMYYFDSMKHILDAVDVRVPFLFDISNLSSCADSGLFNSIDEFGTM